MIIIHGDNICIRSFTREECHRFWKSYVSDPIMDPNPYVYNKEGVDERYNSIIEKRAWYPRLGIFLGDDMIGEVSFKRIDYEKSRCELGIVLANDSYKGLGYGTKAIGLSIDYLFNTLKLSCIYADTMGSNLKMQKIFNKFGFEFLNKEEHFYDMKDRWEDKLNYRLSNPKWTI